MQTKALKELEQKLNFKLDNVGSVEWDVFANIAHKLLNYNESINIDKDTPLSEILEKLKELEISSDTNSKIKSNYFKTLGENKTRIIYSFLKNIIETKQKLKQGQKLEKVDWDDISTLNYIPEKIDIFTYSFPCQDISTMGYGKGINENTRSGLLWELKRIFKNNKDKLPKVLVMENVKNLVSKNFIKDFEKWLEYLETLGYKTEYKTLNAIDYGSMQNRERVFAISWLDKNKEFKWPSKIKHNAKIRDIVEFERISEKDLERGARFLNAKSGEWKYNKQNNKMWRKIELKGYLESDKIIVHPDYWGQTLMKSAGIKLKVELETEKWGKIVKLLNGRESLMYMGLSKNDVDKIDNNILLTENKLKMLAGNSIELNTLKALFENIIKYLLN
ncbi:DNA (cytosine-5-)-methyltransferase [Mesomycoplasma molare]|uniref:DNA (cytosine-5-)-methyltransferase n=1 Tax=Mesomycoplasma molare TaxID=171288 RepID=A0ABY5TXS8_9BACT|nr:DNA (cytosine-5-)-methyltransferase [Mesomycoplasma molare]UWD34043.1 DNA (cytosine-5-)-methyltransferase [Mesomycoplasma molare]